MCDKCAEIDKAIVRYRLVAMSIADELTVEQAKKLLSDCLAQKSRLHPQQPKALR